MKKIPLHKKLLLGAAIAGSGYGSYKLFKHTDAGSERMRLPIINPVTPLLLMAADDRNTEIKKASLAAIPGAVIGGASASNLFKKHYNKMANTAADEVAKNVVDMKKNFANTPWYKLGQKRAIKSEIDDTLRAGRETVAKHLVDGRKAGLKGAAIGGLVGGVMGAGLYAGRHYIKNKINNLYNKTVSKENRPNLVNSAENDDYVRTGAVTGGILGALGGGKLKARALQGLGSAALGAGVGYWAKQSSNDNYNSPIRDHVIGLGKSLVPAGAILGAVKGYNPNLLTRKGTKAIKAKGGIRGAAIGALSGAAFGAAGSGIIGGIHGGAVHLKRAITGENNIKSSEAQESLRRVNKIIAGLTVRQATPIFKKIVAKKKALGASTSQAQKAALKILHRIDK